MTDSPALALTPRQREVFELKAQDLSNKLIALRLGISSETVKKLAAQGRARLGVRTDEAAIYRLRNEIMINQKEQV